MELRHLKYFLAVAEEQNFHRAARRLRLAQPALSRQIRNMEEELGTQLFERVPKGARITPSGRAYLEHVRRILAEVDAAQTHVRGIEKGELGVLRIGFNDIASSDSTFGASLRLFRERHPGVRIQLRAAPFSDQIEAIRKEDLDAGFLSSFPHHEVGDYPELEFNQVAEFHFLLAVPQSHRLAKRPTVQLRDLVEQPFIWFTRNTYPLIFDSLLVECAKGGLTPNIVQEAETRDARFALLGAGMGIGFVHSASAHQIPQGVALKRISDLHFPMPYFFVYRKQTKAALVKQFANAVRALQKPPR